ncbi:superoxide dismutase [Candidatus Tenderia electrophaga]|jgi:Fe-Mn family superoxide dismutase|uniref:Superoxide dismutase n=1 Tax=Candidatus Tenderia electrophaga TaxID=1748243 RepID=A0A0S2TFM8_9GAMM|nr:superoxide dismutase [Candidatus Tenderia electrophaga]
MPIELPSLPYPKNGLEPYLSAETLEFHHDKHHQKYVSKLNGLIKDTEFAAQSLETIITTAPIGPIFNNAAQVWNHNFYWRCLTPNGEQQPEDPLAEAIDSSFGSYDQFKAQFNQAATDLFGVGWVWLVKDGAGVVSILATKDADNPLKHGRIALLTCDVWEHAFYIDYRNDKARYMQAFWQVCNLRFAEERYRAN